MLMYRIDLRILDWQRDEGHAIGTFRQLYVLEGFPRAGGTC